MNQLARRMNHLAEFLLLFLLYSSTANDIEISVNISADSYPYNKFWRSTGFSPPESDTGTVKEYLLSKDVQINLALISSLPNKGIEFVRIHWLLSLLTTNIDGSLKWSDLDTVIENIVQNGVKPVFELMGNSAVLKKEKKNIRLFWKNLTSTIVTRYVDKYTESVVKQWKFETWNEPDLTMYNVLNFTLDDYLEYVEGCADGVTSVLPELQLGGPAGLFKDVERHPLCWGFFKHCNNSESRCNISYISLHKKGNGTISGIINGTLGVIDVLKKYYYNLSHIPIVNDESDILVGWSKPEEWRGDVRYAAAVVKTILQFKQLIKEYNIDRISVDNGFLNVPPNYFNQRTLLTRFFDNQGNSVFVQKPVYAAMGLLALLGEEEYSIVEENDDRFAIISTCTKNKWKNKVQKVGVLIGVSNDNMKLTPLRANVTLKLTIIQPRNWHNTGKFVLYLLDNNFPHPQKIWKQAGMPKNPSKELMATLQSVQEPQKILDGTLEKRKHKFQITIGEPSVVLLNLCPKYSKAPGKVRELKALNISYNEVLLKWKEPLRNGGCIKTYVVEHSPNLNGSFERVNKKDIIFNSYDFAYIPRFFDRTGFGEYTRGIYKVRAVDYWERSGVDSDIIKYGI